MGIGSAKGIESMSSRPMGGAQPVDSVIKNIQDEISETQRQRHGLSSKRELSAAEKEKKRQELQQKISDLNRELRQRQAEVRKEQQREALANENRTDVFKTGNAEKKDTKAKAISAKTAAEKNTKADNAGTNAAERTDAPNASGHSADTPAENVNGKALQDNPLQDKAAQDKASQLQDFEIPKKDWKAIVELSSSKEQVRKQEVVIARIEGGIAILKSEIKLDEARGADVEKKQEELKKQNEKLQKASAAQFSSPDQFKPTVENTAAAKTGTAANLSKENMQAAQQPLFKDIAVSLTI